VGNVGSGGAARLEVERNRERGRRRFGGEGADKRALLVGEREREREGGVGRLGWLGPGREKGGAGKFGPSRPREGERGSKGIPFFFFFQNNFSNSFFQMKFEFKTLYKFHTSHK